MHSPDPDLQSRSTMERFEPIRAICKLISPNRDASEPAFASLVGSTTGETEPGKETKGTSQRLSWALAPNFQEDDGEGGVPFVSDITRATKVLINRVSLFQPFESWNRSGPIMLLAPSVIMFASTSLLSFTGESALLIMPA
ncbi:hypothetical protein N7G274_009595 [Stereocaulon virgatum]|uniref:Uncharacterized protein n=1 Tax=Stereocaulon virgatum TaxID=373712 RepID=A0ABR3ZY24_9LECA